MDFVGTFPFPQRAYVILEHTLSLVNDCYLSHHKTLIMCENQDSNYDLLTTQSQLQIIYNTNTQQSRRCSQFFYDPPQFFFQPSLFIKLKPLKKYSTSNENPLPPSFGN